MDAVVLNEGARAMSNSKSHKSNVQLIFHLGTKLAFGVCLAILLFSWSSAQERQLDTSMREFLNNPDRPVVLKGDYMKALLSAYDDFGKILTKHAKDAGAPGSANPELARRLAQIEAYDIQIDLHDQTYLVRFVPTVRDQAHVTFGGGATYTISRKDFKIIDRTLSK
jgi:hypothetical protein